jgi:hypothetical protein
LLAFAFAAQRSFQLGFGRQVQAHAARIIALHGLGRELILSRFLRYAPSRMKAGGQLSPFGIYASAKSPPLRRDDAEPRRQPHASPSQAHYWFV